MFSMDEFQKYGKEQMDAMNQVSATYARNMQQIATEAADYTKKSMEQGAVALEKLLGVKTLDKAIEVQSDYARQAYEGFVAQATRMGELMTGMAKEAAKPFEAAAARAVAK
jgi:hypothetical protein